MTRRRKFTPLAALALALIAGPAVLAPGSAAAPVNRLPRYHILGDHNSTLPKLRSGVMVRKTNGDEYVIGRRRERADSSGHYRVEYFTRRNDAKRWTRNYFSSATLNFGRFTDVDAQLSPSGKQVVTVLNSCHRRSLYVIAIPADRHRPPTDVEPALSGDSDPCSWPPYVDYIGFATAPHGRATVLMDGVSNEKTGGPLVSTGTVGQPFPKPRELPNPGHLETTYGAITRDPVTGDLVVAAYSATRPSGAYVWTKSPGEPWSLPTYIGGDIFPETIAAYGGRIAVAVTDRPFRSRSREGILQRSRRGTWSDVEMIPRTQPDAWSTTVLFDPTTGVLHAVWFRDGTASHNGLMHTTRSNGHWKRPVLLKHQKQTDSAGLSVALTRTGRPLVGYSSYEP